MIYLHVGRCTTTSFFPTIIVQYIQDYVGKGIQALMIVEERGRIGLYELVIEKTSGKLLLHHLRTPMWWPFTLEMKHDFVCGSCLQVGV